MGQEIAYSCSLHNFNVVPLARIHSHSYKYTVMRITISPSQSPAAETEKAPKQ